ncbi:hypothetical protein TSOC_008159 [Tetrabaena socialis]|uniref:Uncharacterized protein n=1 Tax=Tetrabaena socialis TaxID=47790 RepID=A0A2J7ZZ84_9CHLO|nr:hypothetical protein TSOC_008159 [Tetrabaena socialis]|eukprot:PNH05558.1 hypothetical protein TSOC_008159 [Tetrabaena socialis]
MDRMRHDDRGAGAPEGAPAPTLDQVYAAIMSQKRTAQELPQEPPARGAEPAAVRFRSGMGASLRNGTLEQLLLEGLVAGSDDGQGGPLAIMRSNTMENILRDTASGGKDLQDLMLDWNHHLPEEHKFVEGLASDMEAIDAAPPDVLTMRRTFTLERILSGAENDIAGMLRANHHQQQLLQRQQSGAAGSGGAAGSSGGEAAGDAAPPGRPGSRTDKPQCAESLHRLAASSGPGTQPRPGLGGGGAAGANGGAAAGGGGGPMGPPSSRGPGGLLRAAGGSGRFVSAAAALAAEDEEALPRSPKRARLLQHVKAEAAGGVGSAGPGPERTWSKADACLGAGPGPDRSMSASLLDLAKAAAALDGGDLDEGGSQGEREQQGPGTAPDEEGERGEEQQQQQQQEAGESDGAGAEAKAAARAAGSDAQPAVGAGPPEEGGTGRQAEGARKGGGPSALDRSNSGVVSPRPGSAAPAAALPGGGGAAGGPGPAAGEGGIAELLRSLSGIKPGQVGGAPLGRSPGLPLQDTKMMQRLQAEVDRLQRDNEALNGHLELVLSQVDIVQQRNTRMKQMLLEACRAKGIQADMSLLNMSLQHHRTQPMTDAQTTRVAASILGLNGGNVLASVQQMISIFFAECSAAGVMGPR